jgi:hypothetical protein
MAVVGVRQILAVEPCEIFFDCGVEAVQDLILSRRGANLRAGWRFDPKRKQIMTDKPMKTPGPDYPIFD